MSDGITDAKRECKPIKYTSPRINPAPIRCNQCIFIARPPPDAQWECTNPLQSESCFDVGVCNFHLTLDELSEYIRQRLVTKLTMKTPVLDTIPRELQSCSDCVFCILTEVSYQDYVYICNLGLDEIFHERNHDKWDTLGCESINKQPTTPCKSRYTDEEMCKLLGV